MKAIRKLKITRISKNKLILVLSLGVVVAIVIYSLISKVINYIPPQNTKADLPSKEKVAEGVWKLNNYDPIKEVLAEGKKADLNLKEVKIDKSKLKSVGKNTEQSKSSITTIYYDTLKYRWSVTNTSGTKFEFGGVDKNTPDGKVLPIVKITNKEGYFVAYSSSNDQLPVNNFQYVVPLVKGNTIEWEIAKGITARYTMQADRVKADYIVNSKESIANGKLDFEVQSGSSNNKQETISKNQENSKSFLIGELMPGGDIEWFIDEDGGAIKTQFTFPKPIVYDNSKVTIDSEYEFQKVSSGKYQLSIVLNTNDFEKAIFPITIDPVVIDSTATATGTAYGNERKILRDGWGNLIVLIDGGTASDNVYYKNYDVTFWTNANIDVDAGSGSANYISADLDATGSAHLVYINSTDSDLEYLPLKVTRSGNNTISSIGTTARQDLQVADATRPSLTIANKGGGDGVEKIVVAYASNTTNRGEIRVMQRDVASANYQAKILATTGLTGYWRLGESSNANPAVDLSSTANNGTYTGNLPTVGVSGAVNDGNTAITTANVTTNSGVSVPDNAAYEFDTSTSFTAEIWVKRNGAPSANAMLFDHGGDNGSGEWEIYWQAGGEVLVSRPPSADSNLTSGTETISDNRWHHIVLTVDRSTGLAQFYKDGKASGAPQDWSASDFTGTTNNLFIGRRNTATLGCNSCSFDEAATYKGVALTQSQILDHYQAGSAWKNASEEINANGTASDTATSSEAGFPSSGTNKGTTDKLLEVAATTSDHGVITQMPSKSKRSPKKVYYNQALGGGYVDQTNMYDNNTVTGESGIYITGTQGEFLDIGDDKPYSKISIDLSVVNTNASTALFTYYYSAEDGSGNCTTQSALSNRVLNNSSSTVLFSEDGSILFDEPLNWVKCKINGVDAYWIDIQATFGHNINNITINEIYINDRNSGALMVAAGVDSTDDLGVAYIPWDDIGNASWENRSDNPGNGWRSNVTALDTLGGNWTGYTNFPLTSTIDYKNNVVYVAYVEDTTTDVLHIKYAPNNKDLSVANNWTDTSFPTVTEAADLSMSLTSVGSDIYLFYVLDAGTNSLVFRQCQGSGGGLGGVCDNSSDWGIEKTIYNDTTVAHPQAIVTKPSSDLIAFDLLLTDTTDTDVVYERHFVDLNDVSESVYGTGDDAYQRDCVSGTDDQDVTATTVKLGRDDADTNCVGSVDSLNHIGLRFPNIPVATGAAISSAYVDFRVNGRTGSGAISFIVYGEDSNDSVAYTAFTDCADPCSNGLNTRTKTTNSIPYSVDFTTNTYRLDVTNIVQEIVCRGASNSQPCVGNFNSSGTWEPGNALSIIMIANGTDTGSDNTMTAISKDDTTVTMIDPTLQINCVNRACGADTRLVSTTINATPDYYGAYTSMVLGFDSFPVISTSDPTLFGSIAIIKCNDTGCKGSNETESNPNVTSSNGYNSLALGNDGIPVFAYYDDSGGNLKVLKCNDIACAGFDETDSTVDSSANDVGNWNSIAIGSDGFPVIAYYDATANGGNLKVAKCNDTACTGANETISTVDSNANDRGNWTDIAIGTDTFPIISYMDNTVGGLYVAKCNDTACTGANETVTRVTTDIAADSSIVIGLDGLPVISYYDVSFGVLKVAKCNDTSCAGSNETITTLDDPANNVGGSVSMVVGPDGNPVMSYYDTTNGHLKVAKCINPSCTGTPIINTIDFTDVAYGFYTKSSIVNGSDGFPVIAYGQDSTLKVIKCNDLICLGSTAEVFSPGKKYSMSADNALPTGSGAFADLSKSFSSADYVAVSTDDTNYASISATTNYASSSAQPAFMFKVNNSNNNNSNKIDASVIVKSNIATSYKPVYLQVYRGGSTDDWVTVASNNSTTADTDFNLIANTIDTNTSEYYFNETPGIGTQYAECTNGTANCWTYWRIYQEAPNASFNEVLSLDYVNISFTDVVNILPQRIRGGTRLQGGSRIR